MKDYNSQIKQHYLGLGELHYWMFEVRNKQPFDNVKYSKLIKLYENKLGSLYKLQNIKNGRLD